jgi:uncharacterized protein YbaP (TraB family)
VVAAQSGMSAATLSVMIIVWRTIALRLLLAAALCLVRPGAAHAESKPAMWKVTSAKGTAYLLGSIHVARPDLYPLAKPIEDAFSASDALVVEVDASDANALAATMVTRAAYAGSDTIRQHVSAELLDQVAKRFARHGLPMAQLERMKPWFLAVSITSLELQKVGVAPEYGVDLHFLEQAKGRKEIVELESAESQIQVFDGFDDRQQELFLRYTMKDLDDLGQHLEELVTAWKTGDATKLAKLLNEAVTEAPELRPIYEKLFDERNRLMANRLEELLGARRTYFVVVGAGHLLGDSGLVGALGRKYRVERQ